MKDHVGHSTDLARDEKEGHGRVLSRKLNLSPVEARARTREETTATP